MDGIFSIVILLIGFLVVSSNRTDLSQEMPLSVMSENAVDLLTSVKFSDMCESCNCSNRKVRELCIDGSVRNREQSLLDSAGELYSRGLGIKAGELFMNITVEKNIINENLFGSSLEIDGQEIYTSDAGMDKSRHIISYRKIIFGFYETPSTGEITYWGPYTAEVDLWEK